MHFVYLYKQSGDGELRYSIRSICDRFKVDSITVVGDCPDWLTGVNHVRPSGGRSWSRYGQMRRDLHSALPDCPPEFVFMNDDFFAMRQTTIPNWHRGRFRTFRKPDKDDRGGWRFALTHTAWVLREWGYKPLNYEVHAPMKMIRDDLATVLDTVSGTGWETVQLRSLYGNVADVGGTQHEDVLHQRDDRWRPSDAAWVSCSDKWWRDGQVGGQVRDMYPEPSKFERQ